MVLLTHLDWNLQRLSEVLSQESTEYFKSAALQRFGHTYTMAMKCIQGFAESQEDINDEQCIALATQNGWTEAPATWQKMTVDYRCINQNPSPEETQSVFLMLPRYQEVFKTLYTQLQTSA